MRVRVPRALYVLLFVYIAISLGYQVLGSVSLVVGYFDLRKQVTDPGLSIGDYTPAIKSVSEKAAGAGLAVGDVVESLNGVPYTGRAVMQSTRWYAHPGETLQVGVRKPDGSRTTIAIPLRGFGDGLGLGDTVFLMILHIVMPLLCLILGYWVVLARPTDPHAWIL